MKAGEWDARCKTRTEELLASAETIKILNDDDARTQGAQGQMARLKEYAAEWRDSRSPPVVLLEYVFDETLVFLEDVSGKNFGIKDIE